MKTTIVLNQRDPSLLEASKDALAFLEAILPGQPSKRPTSDYTIVRKLRAAIEKAEGKK